MQDPLIDTLQAHFGLTQFRSYQREVIDALLGGNSSLAILPTGSGKSLIYQLTALHLPGVSLVISPLISLIRDQTQALSERAYPVAWIDSTQSTEERARQLDFLENGPCKLFYLSPESLTNKRLLTILKSLKISLITIDEAHCISEWGHSFRPSYLYLPKLVRQLKPSVTLALTATATPKTASHIRKLFAIKSAHQFGVYLPRPNLHYHITRCLPEDKNLHLLEFLASSQSLPAVVYAMRQEQCEEITHFLTNHGYKARAYHAGMSSSSRSLVQDDFLSDTIQIVVATIAFGMGVDKPNIRSVIHYHLPKSPEGWVQESGRAGRDGKLSHCHVLACADDLIPLQNFSEAKRVRTATIQSLIHHLFSQGKSTTISPYHLRVLHDIHSSTFDIIIARLEVNRLLRFQHSSWRYARAWPVAGRRLTLKDYPPKMRLLLDHIFNLGDRFDTDTCLTTYGIKADKLWLTLESLHSQGDIVLLRSGWLWTFQILQAPKDLSKVANSLASVLSDEIANGFAKLDAIHRITKSKKCINTQLARWFGNQLTEDCTHCTSCLNASSCKQLPSSRTREVDTPTLEIIKQLSRNSSFHSNQQLARFLAGIPSPYLRHHWLTRHPHFGLLVHLPYTDSYAYAKAFLNAQD